MREFVGDVRRLLARGIARSNCHHRAACESAASGDSSGERSRRRTSCSNNLRQIGLALKLYAQANSDWNAPAYISSSQHWMTEIQPFVQNYEIFRCPTAPDIKDGYSGLNLGYGMNCYNFLRGSNKTPVRGSSRSWHNRGLGTHRECPAVSHNAPADDAS